MKKIITILSAISVATTAIAQTECSNNDPFFTFSGTGMAKEVRTLGSNPEFPFLRNMSSPKQVYAAIKRNENNSRNQRGMSEFNNLMRNIGYTNGVQDLQESAITEAYIPPGTEGNMGSGGYTSGYYRFAGNAGEFKAWKIAGNGGANCYVYIMAKCGNAFYPNTATKTTACITAPVNVTSEPREITMSNAQQNKVEDKVYVYYHRKTRKKPYVRPEIADENPSKALLLSSATRTEVVPETYRVSVSSPADNVLVCPDKRVDVAAGISFEKISGYTGYYPKPREEYRLISKRVYRKSARKMRKAARKEARVAKLTGVPVVHNNTVAMN